MKKCEVRAWRVRLGEYGYHRCGDPATKKRHDVNLCNRHFEQKKHLTPLT